MATRNIPVHPSSHHPSTLSSRTFDIIIIGSGPVANFAAARLSKAGLSIAVIESELYGGDCPFWACVPSKALLRPAEVLEAAQSVSGAREKLNGDKADPQAVFRRRDEIVRNWDDRFFVNVAESKGIHIVRGRGRLTNVPKQVSVQAHGESNDYKLFAKHAVIIATGSTHIHPSIPGFSDLKEGKELWTNREAVSADYIPEHLIILGAGAVGTEMAILYSSLGGRVTLLSKSTEILPRAEPEAAAIVRQSLQARGVNIKLSAIVTAVEKPKPGNIIVVLETGERIQGSTILNAIGRKPRTFDLGLETLSLPGEGAPLNVDTNLRVPVPGVPGKWLYAIGDVNGLAPTTHMGVHHARLASNAILASLGTTPYRPPTPSCVSERTNVLLFPAPFPQVIFTQPSLATAGHTYASALASGIKARKVDASFMFPGAQLYGDGYTGFARWIVEEGTERLIGATFCCNEAAELLGASSVAINLGAKVGDLVRVVMPFPTRGEVWLELLGAAGY